MPKTEELPDSLSKLARRQAIVLTDLNFGDGIGRLMQAVDLPTHANDTSAPAMRLQNMFRALAAALVLLVAAGTYLTWRTHSKKAALDVTPANPPPGVLSLADLKNAYRIPKNLDGRGQTIGMIELDGGYLDSDIQKYFADAHLSSPTIFTKSVDKAVNKSGSDSDSSVTLGLEVAGGIAPAAQIVVYFAKNTAASFVHAIEAASNDTVHHPSVLLIAWGQPEEGWSLADRTDLNYALGTAAVQKHITVVTAAGDNGPTDGMKDGKLHVDFPASSPFVLAVGGTQLRTPFTREGTQGEDFLSGPGRGTSSMFFKPDWQKDLPGTRRAIPDVAADATSRYQIILRGAKVLVGGTSASATLWAGLLALVAQQQGGAQGVINPFLYQTLGPRKTLRAVPSNTAECRTIKGWNTCTGWGSPVGEKFVAAFQ
jgi:kumamolisin